MTVSIEIRRACPYCDMLLDMTLTGVHDRDTITCPWCCSLLGTVNVNVSLDWYIDAEDRDYAINKD